MWKSTLVALALTVLVSCGGEPAAEPEPPEAGAPAGRIAFVSDRDGNGEIYLVNPDGTGLTRLTNTPLGEEWPAWSPDGKSLAYLQVREGKGCVYVMPAEGGETRRVTPPDMDAMMPAWSPAGDRLAFVETTEQGLSIHTIAVAGGEPTRLTEGMSPAWSPDGRHIYFTRGNLPQLTVMNADGGNVRPVLKADVDLSERGFFAALSPVPSPDGNRLLFTGVIPPGEGGSMNHEVFTMSLDGLDPERRTNENGADLGCGWSPNGEWIVLVSERDGNPELYVMRSDGSEVRRLTSDPAPDRNAAWSRK